MATMSEQPKIVCPVCGGDNLSEGWLTSFAFLGRSPVELHEPDRPKATIKREGLMARRCEQCGNVQLFMGKPKPKHR
jgi:DNA-directed RNA polymerase subunit RPC12/RpoP